MEMATEDQKVQQKPELEQRNKQIIGDKIKAARISLGMTQKQLSKKSGISQAAISQYEMGKRMPFLRHYMKLARSLNISSGCEVESPTVQAIVSELKKFPEPLLLSILEHVIELSEEHNDGLD